VVPAGQLESSVHHGSGDPCGLAARVSAGAGEGWKIPTLQKPSPAGKGSRAAAGFFFSELHLRRRRCQGARDLDSNKSPLPRARPSLIWSSSVNFRAVDFLSFRFFRQASNFRTLALARLASHRQAHPDGWSRTRPLSQVSNSPTQRDLTSQVAASTTQQPNGVESSRVIPGPLESQLTTHKSPDSPPESSRPRGAFGQVPIPRITSHRPAINGIHRRPFRAFPQVSTSHQVPPHTCRRRRDAPLWTVRPQMECGVSPSRPLTHTWQIHTRVVVVLPPPLLFLPFSQIHTLKSMAYCM
jgi:hypothetical protein